MTTDKKLARVYYRSRLDPQRLFDRITVLRGWEPRWLSRRRWLKATGGLSDGES